MSVSSSAPPGTAFDRAWADYLDALDEVRRTILADPACADQKVRDAALYLPVQSQAVAFYMQLAPHKGYPLLHRTHTFEPFGINYGMGNPDFDYRWTYLDGSKHYRIHGPRKSGAAFFDIIAFNGYFRDDLRTYFHGAINQFGGPDGGIDIRLGPAGDGRSHIELDPAEPHNVLTLRETLEDWSVDEPTPLRIECIDPPTTRGPFLYPEADVVARLERATMLIRNGAKRTTDFHHQVLAGTEGALNEFYVRRINETTRTNNGHPDMVATHCYYHVEPGQALIVETEMPKHVNYWGIQMADLWWRTTDFIWHQTSLNRSNGHWGADGLFRAVVSHEDPGIQNWLDPLDNERGNIMIRVYQGSDTPRPRTRLVPIADVRKHLPADTPEVTPAERQAQIAERADTVLRRFGY